MALACASRARGGGARFLDFGGFLRFLTRYRKEPSDGSRFAKLGFSFAVRGCRLPDRCPLLTRFARRLAVAGCGIAGRGSRIMAGDLLASMFGTKSAGHGAA